MRTGPSVEHSFSGLPKEDLDSMQELFSSKNIAIVSEADGPTQKKRPRYDEGSDVEERAGSAEEESTDEEYKSGDGSGEESVDEEYDEDYESEEDDSVTESDAEGDGDGETDEEDGEMDEDD